MTVRFDLHDTFFFLADSLYILFFYPSDLVVGFVDREYSVSEGDGSITVFVEIKQGIVGSGETVTLEFTTRDNTATSMFRIEEYLFWIP